jgi:Ni2+-binding GTPase involved in maturation of urease and hydrogenase
MNKLSTDVRLKMAPVEVIVKGIAGSGKTAILTLIQQTLTDHGFTSVIALDPEETAEQRAANLKKVLAEKDPDYFCKSITLVMEHKSTLDIHALGGTSGR